MAAKAKSTGTLVLFLIGAALVWWLNNRENLGGESAATEGGSGYAWVEHRHNDGDSFHIRNPEGEEQEIRLYYVDAPESALKTYRDGNDNYRRVDDQAKDLGLDRNRTVKVGKMAKEWVKETLRGKDFTVFTYGEEVFEGPRVYAFVEVQEEGKKRWLHELLVERGLVRIHTKGAKLPDGTARRSQEKRLRDLAKKAKAARAGAWGLR